MGVGIKFKTENKEQNYKAQLWYFQINVYNETKVFNYTVQNAKIVTVCYFFTVNGDRVNENIGGKDQTIII